MRAGRIRVSTVAGVVLATAVMSAGCGVQVERDTRTAPPASTAAPRAGTGSLGRQETCAKAADTYARFTQAVLDVIPSNPGPTPSYDPKLVDAFRAKATTTAAELRAEANVTSDAALATQLTKLSDAITEFVKMPDILAAQTQGDAVDSAENELSRLCPSP